MTAAVALAAYLALGVWQPWADGDYPGCWLACAAVCAFAFLWCAAALVG